MNEKEWITTVYKAMGGNTENKHLSSAFVGNGAFFREMNSYFVHKARTRGRDYERAHYCGYCNFKWRRILGNPI